MKITFYRNGFANNSSSTHSLIHSNNLQDHLSCDDFEYGWENFVLSSKDEKLKYLFAILYNTWTAYNHFDNTVISRKELKKFSWEQFTNFINENFPKIFDNTIKQLNDNEDINIYIDHQSVLIFPLHRNYDKHSYGDEKQKFYNIEFAKDFINLIANNNFVICGGNDNSDSNPYESADDGQYENIKTLWNILRDTERFSTFVEKDEYTNEYIISSKKGPICKVVFDGEKKQNKSKFPYLVDVKITDKCSVGCEFCYMNSTPQGKSASIEYIKLLAETLAKANVFEVAIGGGSVEEYLDDSNKFCNYTLLSAIEEFKQNNFKIGITTRNYNFHKIEYAEQILKQIDSVAISCSTIEDLENAKDLYWDRNLRNPSIQYILESNDEKYLKKFLKKMEDLGMWNLTILGAKNCGRGELFQWFAHTDKWIKTVKQSKLTIGIDSILVTKYYNDLIKSGVKYYCLEGTEGKSTCFIDAVNQKLYPSSFDKSHNGINLEFSHTFSNDDKNVDTFLEAFAKV